MDFQDRSVVVTGGTGALGSAVVGALLEAGASCHIPVFNEAELTHFPHRAHPKVATYPGSNLTDEAAVTGLFEKVPKLWASIHIAGGFAAGPMATTGKAVLMGQVDTNLVTTFLCCRAACVAMAGRGGPHRQRHGASGARMAHRRPAWWPIRRPRPRSPRSPSRSPRRW